MLHEKHLQVNLQSRRIFEKMAEGGEDDLLSQFSCIFLEDEPVEDQDPCEDVVGGQAHYDLAGGKGGQQNPTKMALLNIRSINKKESTIKDLITKNKLSVFCLTETFTNENTADESFKKVLLENFTAHHWSRDGRGGGVAILCSKDLKAERILEDVKSSVTSFEYVAVEIEGKGNNFIIITVYRPPGGKITTFFEKFKKFVVKVSKKYTSIIVSGDFNIHMDEEQHRNTKNLNDLLKQYDLKQHVEKPTHNKGHILDLVITRGVKITRPRKDVRHDIPETDHCTVYFNTKPKVQPNDPKKGENE